VTTVKSLISFALPTDHFRAVQTLHAVSRAVAERENMTAGRLLFAHVHNQSAQSLEREAKIRYPVPTRRKDMGTNRGGCITPINGS
jgi:hypothetical protein